MRSASLLIPFLVTGPAFAKTAEMRPTDKLSPTTASAVACGSLLEGAGAGPTALVDLGHTTFIRFVQQSGDRVLSRGDDRWILWDTTTHTQIVSDVVTGRVQLSGSTLLVQSTTTVQLRSAVDGQLLFSIQTGGNVGLTIDGLYAWAATSQGISAWDLSGQTAVTASGNYSNARIFGSDGELRVALSPTQPDAIEIFDLSTGGRSVTSPFIGTFHSWFLDGQRFLTNVSTTIWIYSKSAVQLEIIGLPSTENLTGQGDYFWTYRPFSSGYPLDIYGVGGSPTPVVTYGLPGQPAAIPSANKIGIVPIGVGRVDIVSLDSTVTMSSHAVPMASLSAFGSDGSNWLVGNYHGVIFESRSSQPLGCGEVWSMAGAENGTAAVATASGKILVFSLQPSGHTLTGSIDFASSHVELSADGTLLAAMGNARDQYWPDRSVKIFSLPDFRETATWPHRFDDPNLFQEFAFSRSGDHLAHLEGIGQYSRRLTDVPGTVTYFSDTSRDFEIYKLSPNGNRFSLNHSYGCGADCAAQLFDGGTLVGAVAGRVVGWLDNDRVLATREGQGARIYNSRGALLFTPNLNLTCASGFQVVSPTRIYVCNSIIDLEDGSEFSHQGGVGAVAGEFIIYPLNAQVFAQRFTRAEDASFRPTRNFASGSTPFSVAVGDFNGDGLPDLAVANYVDPGTISVLLGNTGGDFQAPQSFSAGSFPFSVAVGDFNGDGSLDLAVANVNSNDVSVLLGNWDGSFQTARHFAVGNSPLSVAVGDFNGDGSLDLAVANINSDNISVLLGNGDGTFQPAQNFGSGHSPSSVAVGDFNGDGRLDLAVSNSGDWDASILLGNGDGTFQEASNFGVGSTPVSVAVSDVDGDGSLDLVVANQNSNDVSVLLGNGDGTFRPAQSFGAGHFPWSVVIGDVNGDGRPDLVVTSENSNAVSILLGNGDGTFQALQSFAAGSTPVSAALGDFNADGLVDLVVANRDSNNISVLINSRLSIASAAIPHRRPIAGKRSAESVTPPEQSRPARTGLPK